MSLSELAVSGRIVGSAKVLKAFEEKNVRKLFLASDAEGHLLTPFVNKASEQHVPVEYAENRKILGRACAIGCGTMVAAIAKNKDSCFS